MAVPKFEIRQVKEFSDVDGTQRAPSIGEDLKNLYWDNTTGRYKYRDDIHLTTAEREDASNRAEFTLSDGSKVYLELGSLAWSNDEIPASPVTSVFGRTGDVISAIGDYSAAQVTNAFDTSSDTLDDITEGTTNKHLTTVLKANYDYAYSVAHTHTNKAILDNITSAGSGQVITDAERTLLYSYAANTAEYIRDTVAEFVKTSSTISWTHNDVADTLTGNINFTSFDSDSITEGNTNLFYSDDKVYASLSVTSNPGLGTLALDGLTGVFTYSPPTAGQVRNLFTGIYPILYSPTSGQISIDPSAIGSGGGEGVPQTLEVSQSTHGFVLYDAVKISQDTGLWVKTKADTASNAGTLGLVIDVVDANNFVVQFNGFFAINPNPFDVGQPYFLSQATSGLAILEPTYADGEVREHLFTSLPTGILIEPDLGDVVSGFDSLGIPAGTVEAVAAGDGMTFVTIVNTGYVTMGTPSPITSTSIDEVTTDSHTHSLDATGVTPGSYTLSSITVDDKGRITAASSGTQAAATVIVEDSMAGDGSVGSPLHLDGDVPSPGPYHVYGTNVSGTRGWYEVAATDGHIEDILFEFRDIEAGTPQEYILDISASFTYDIVSLVLQSDATLQGVHVDIDGMTVTGLSSVTATTSIVETAATAMNSVSAGSKLTITTDTTFTGTPTLLRGKIKYRRT